MSDQSKREGRVIPSVGTPLTPNQGQRPGQEPYGPPQPERDQERPGQKKVSSKTEQGTKTRSSEPIQQQEENSPSDAPQREHWGDRRRDLLVRSARERAKAHQMDTQRNLLHPDHDNIP